LNSKNINAIIKQIQGQWTALVPDLPFSYHFLDESFDDMYRVEQRAGKIALLFSSLAIFIACLGLFGLASFIAELRTKEIGIRKLLGASISNIITILSGNFLKLIGIAFILAVSLAWYFMNGWLQDFAYRITIGWWVFPLAGLLVTIIALITVSFQAIKAAIANPIGALKSE
jgi:putative ABC transport system permease protein